MKKIVLLLISCILLSGILAACTPKNASTSSEVKEAISSSRETNTDIRQIVFEQLSSEVKGQVQGSWQDAMLSTAILKEQMGIITDKTYINKEVYVVDFTTKSISNPNNIIYFASKDSKKIIGTGYVD